MFKFIASIFVLALCGCASNVTYMTVNTQPPGAFVTELGTMQALGVSPTVAQYPKMALTVKDAAGCSMVRGFRVRWVSGATAQSTESVRLCGNLDSYAISISRDPNAAGLEQDLDFALKISNANAQQRQAAAMEAAAAFQLLGTMQLSAPVSCTTSAVGKSLQTNCK